MRELIKIDSASGDVLKVLLAADGELNGSAIARSAGRTSMRTYPVLARFEAAGWVQSRWDEPGADHDGDRRRLYKLGTLGRAAAVYQIREANAAKRRAFRPSGSPTLVGVLKYSALKLLWGSR